MRHSYARAMPPAVLSCVSRLVFRQASVLGQGCNGVQSPSCLRAMLDTPPTPGIDPHPFISKTSFGQSYSKVNEES